MPAFASTSLLGPEPEHIGDAGCCHSWSLPGLSRASRATAFIDPELVGGLREVKRKVTEMQREMDLYRISKADASRAADTLWRMKRKGTAGNPVPDWYAATDHAEEINTRTPTDTKAFDKLLKTQHEAQMTMAEDLRGWAQQNGKTAKYTQQVVRDAAEAAHDVAGLVGGQRKVGMPQAGQSSVSPLLALLPPPQLPQASQEKSKSPGREAYSRFLVVETSGGPEC